MGRCTASLSQLRLKAGFNHDEGSPVGVVFDSDKTERNNVATHIPQTVKNMFLLARAAI